MRGKDICECDVQSIMAVHLFEPLVANSTVIADESSYKRYKVEPSCRFCNKEVAVGNTSIGKACFELSLFFLISAAT